MPYGNRQDGTKKGPGFFGELPMEDGSNRVATEISIGVDDREIPSLVPTLDDDEKKHLLKGGKPTPGIIGKAAAHAREREKQGMSPFAEYPEVRAIGGARVK